MTVWRQLAWSPVAELRSVWGVGGASSRWLVYDDLHDRGLQRLLAQNIERIFVIIYRLPEHQLARLRIDGHLHALRDETSARAGFSLQRERCSATFEIGDNGRRDRSLSTTCSQHRRSACTLSSVARHTAI
jgi:hypothetical protein